MSNSAKQKVNIPKTERQMYGCHEPYLQIFTISHFPVLLGFLVNTHCCWCGFHCVQLFNLVFYYGLESYTSHHDRVKTAPASAFRHQRNYSSVERVERLIFFKNRWEGLQMDLSLTIFLCNPSVLREDTSLGEIF